VFRKEKREVLSVNFSSLDQSGCFYKSLGLWNGFLGRLSPYFIRIISGEICRPFIEKYSNVYPG
jgi:hypothetical protein